MRKKLSYILVALLLIFAVTIGLANADVSVKETLEKIPALKQGIGYSILDNKINYLSTIELIKWKGFCGEVGYNQENKLIGVISYELLKLKDLGVTLPILDLLECNVGIYAGSGRIENFKEPGQFDTGLSATFIRLKW